MSKSVAAQLHVLILFCSPAWSLNSQGGSQWLWCYSVVGAAQPSQTGSPPGSGLRKDSGGQLESQLTIPAIMG